MNFPDQLSKSMHLYLDYDYLDRRNVTCLCEDIGLISSLAHIYHLTTHTDAHTDILARLLPHLPVLDSLQIASLPLPQSETLSDHKESILQLIPSTTRITKVYLETVYDIEEIFFLFEHFAQLMYLKVNSIKNLDEKIFVRLILMKIKINLQYQLRLLSFHVSRTDDHMIKVLKKMIDEEK